jgi:serine/threonine protein kinase
VTSIRRTCSCGAENAEGAAICRRCGADLTIPSRTSSPSGNDGEDGGQAAGAERGDRTPAGAVAVAELSIHDSPTRPHQSFDEGSVLGSYRLIKQIGAGGMGRVFVAEHTRLGRKVALKLLRPEYSGHQEAVKRFFAEARTVNRINHQHIIEISDFIEGQTGPSFYIMELLEGLDLRALGLRTPYLPLRRALDIAIQVASALGAAHQAGVIHRDLKPENIFLVERQGRKDFVKLLDFGVAKLLNAKLDELVSFKSIDGVVVGTPEYMAPEQALGEAVDHRADIYSFGVILFEMITGRPPFRADSAREHMAKHIMATPPRPTRLRAQARDVPALDDVILACLEKSPSARPLDMQDVERRLGKILESLPEPGETPELRGGVSRRGLLWGGVLGTGAIGMGGLLAWLSGRLSKHAPPAPRLPERVLRLDPSQAGAAPEAGVPGRVQVIFVSTPPGASVFRAGSDHPLGVTPFSASLTTSPEVATFEFRLDGWREERTALSLRADAEATVVLSPVEARSPASQTSRAAGSGTRVPVGAGTRGGARKARLKGASRAPEVPEPPGSPPSKPVPLDRDVVLNPFE